MTNERFHALFGEPPRQPETKLTQKEMDLAASVQVVTEEIMLRLARRAHEVTGKQRLCMAGGVALNCVANGRILREGPFEEIWIQPAAGDAGARWARPARLTQVLDRPRSPTEQDSQRGSLLGPEYSTRRSPPTWTRSTPSPRSHRPGTGRPRRPSPGRREGDRLVPGPDGVRARALGARSVIGDARNPGCRRR